MRPPDRRAVSLTDLPLWSDVVTRISVRKSFQIILVFWLGLPEWSFRYNLSHNPPRPFAGGLHVTNGPFGDPPLLLVCIENGGAVACTDVVALTVQRGWIVNLKEKLEQLPVA